MKIEVTHKVVFDTEELWAEFEEYQDDHPLTISALQEFIIDRFINPNFAGGKTTMEIVGK